MKIIVQAFTGGFYSLKNGHISNIADIAERLSMVTNKAQADAVIIGWNLYAPYDQIISALHALGKKVFLWLPVFSEYGENAAAAYDYLGNKHERAVTDAEDDFTFACPSNIQNRTLAGRYFDQYFGQYPFDGVFLDKIRFSSFGNGFRSGMGCFCPECCHFYRDRGLDIDLIKKWMRRGQKDFLVPAARRDMRYIFENQLIDDFFRFRTALITTSTKSVIDFFRAKGLLIGLDVFAPPFAYLFGQDIAALARHADFIKPMTYRVTHAPAGIPYESEHMKTELLKNGCGLGNQLENLWNTGDLASEDCFINQLALLSGMPCEICAGVEVNRMAFCATSPAYVTQTIETIQTSAIAGCVLSWNVLAETVYP